MGRHPTDALFQFLLGVAVGLVSRPGGLAEVVELAQLVGHTGQGLGHGLANRVLAVGDDADDRHRQAIADLAEEFRQLLLAAGQQALG